MKKILALLLCLLTVLTLAACGEQQETTNSDNSTTASADGSTAESKNEEASSETSSEEAAVPSFDTGWAKNAFERLIPELPFEGWTVKKETDTVYELEVTGLNTSAATNAPDSGEKDGADKDMLIAYLDTLPGYGFTVKETGAGYKWLVTDADGNEIEVMIGDGGCWVTITKKAADSNSSSSNGNDNSSAQTPSFDTSWASNEFERQIPEPPMKERTGETLSNGYLISSTSLQEIKALSAQAITDYCDALKAAGFTFTSQKEVKVNADRMGCEIYAVNAAGYQIMFLDAGNAIVIEITAPEH